MGQTVNLLAYAFGGSNPSLPTKAMIEYKSFIAFVFYPRRRENPRYAEGEMKAHTAMQQSSLPTSGRRTETYKHTSATQISKQKT